MLAVGLGLLVYFTRPDRAQNRLLGLVLVLEGVSVGSGTGLMYLTDDWTASWALQALTDVVALSVPWVYLLFIRTLDAPLARPLRPRPVGALLLAMACVAPVAFFLWTPHFLDPTQVRMGPGFYQILYVWAAVGVFGFAAALSALLHAPRGSARRRQARAYAVAFGVRDLGWALVIVVHRFVIPIPGAATYVAATVIVLFALLLAYGILKTQLFAIDLKLKWTIHRGTIAGIVLAGFLAVSQLVENLASDSLGLIAGSVAAGLLLFAIQPLSRFAHGVADRAMPHVRDTIEYRLVRKREVYRAALEGALLDGRVTDKERDILAALADELQLGARDVLEVERALAETPRRRALRASGVR